MVASISSSSTTTSSHPSANPQYLVETVSHLREAAVNLREALAFANIPGLFAAEAQQRRDLYTDLDALLAQLDAMRMQLAEYVEAAEDNAEHVH
jgi:hypothetical protein